MPTSSSPTYESPYLEPGTRGFTDDNGTWICTGAMMGRPTIVPENTTKPVKLHLHRVRLVDGDYDQGGAYWGGGFGLDPLFCAFGDGVQVFLRARHRTEAKAKIRHILPNARFYR